MPIPDAPSPADIAAIQSYTTDPDNEAAAAIAVVAATGWSTAEATAYLETHRDWMQEIVSELRDAARATGGNLQQAARLSARR